MNQHQVKKVAKSLLEYPAVSVELATKLAKQYYGRYAQRCGSMVVDVVASAWRNYDRVENQNEHWRFPYESDFRKRIRA